MSDFLSGLANRNLLILFCCQMLFVGGTVVLITVGGIVGHAIAPAPSWATLPVALMVVGTALTTIPAAMSMQRLGRRGGFLVGTAVAATGALLASVALSQDTFWLFCLATFLIGSSLGFSQQFRFAAAESVSLDRVSFAVSFILLGSIAGAFLAPVIVGYSTASDPDAPFQRAFVVLIGLYALAAVLLSGLAVPAPGDEAPEGPARPFADVLRQPAFMAAVLAGMVGQGVMTYVMTAAPISMNVGEGHSLTETSGVIRAHVVAMYLPSLVTPLLIRAWGLRIVMAVGVVAMAATVGVGLAGQHLMHYWFAMVLLGVGWNFLFVSGTTLLTQTYRPSERFKSQACNDFGVFGASAVASLMAGTMLHAYGWAVLLYSAIPALVLMSIAIVSLRQRPAPQPAV